MSKKKPDYSSFFFFNPLPSLVYALESFKILDVNQAAFNLFDYTQQEFLELTLKDLYPKGEIPKILVSHIGMEKHAGNIYFGVFTHKKKNGGFVRMEINGQKVDYLGKECMLLVCQDITDKEEQVRLLQESEKRLKAATDIAKLGYWRLELDANTLTWTDEVYRIWGRKRESFELNFENFFQTIHPESQAAFLEEQRASFAGEKEHDIVHRIILPDNKIRWVHELGRLIRDGDGKPVIFEGTVQDITSHKEEEQRLKLLESVITKTNDAILITEAEPIDEPGPRIIYVNEAFTTMTGYTAEEVIGKSPRILQGPNSNKEELTRLGKALRNWEPCEITTINYKKNGDEFWINFSVVPVADEKGWYTHWIAIERDVTEKKLKQIEIELLGKISLNFSFENDLNTAAREVCKTIGEFGKFELIELWTTNREKNEIQLFTHHPQRSSEREFYGSRSINTFRNSEGLPGKVWSNKEPMLWTYMDIQEEFIRKNLSNTMGLKSVLGIPLIFNNEVLGVLVIGSSRDAPYLEKYTGIFHQLEGFIGSEINRKKLENDLSHLYLAIPDILCLADFQGRFLKMNKAGIELLGYSKEEILCHSFDEFVHPDDRDISSSEVMKLGEGETTFKFENRYLTKSGDIIWLSWTCNSAIEEGLIYATAKNITEEKKLRELNRQANTLAKIGSWEVDLIQGKAFWSDMVHELHETDPLSFVPDLENGLKFYHKDFLQIVRDHIEKCIGTGEAFDIEALLVTAKKKERWIRAIGKAEFADGQCLRIYGSFQDIHDRKEAEVRLQSLADNLPGVVFQYIIYPDGNDSLKYVTKGAHQIWGFDQEKIIANNALVWDQIKAGGNFDEVQESIVGSIKTRSKWSARWKYILPSGEVKTHLGYGSPYFLADGSVTFNSVILDITQEAKNEDLLEQATDMAKIGSWELDLIDRNGEKMYWSPMTMGIFEVQESYDPSLSGGFEFYTEVSRQCIRKAFDSLIQQANEFDEELLIVTAKGKEKWIRCIGKSERVRGKCVKIYGSFQDIHSSKSLELQIREILGSISDAFYAVNGDWNFTYFNTEAERLLQKQESDVLGKNIWEVFPATVGTPLEKIYYRVAETLEPESFEYFFKGDGKWYEINAYPSGSGMSVYFKNIDERKQAAAKLEKAFQEKNNILESIGDAFFAVDRNWTVTYWNKEAENLLGRKRADIIGHNLWEVYTDAIDLDFYRQYHTAMETGETVNFEEYYPTVEKWFEVSAYPSSEGLSIFFKDVTLRKESDIRLLEANERFVKVTEATNDVIWDWDVVNKNFYRSNGIVNFFGKEVSKFISEDNFWQDKFHPKDLPKLQESIQKFMADPLSNRWEMEYRVFNGDGNIVYVIDRGLKIRDERGNVTRMVGAMTDITERKNFEQQLLELNTSLRRHSHELELTNEQLEQFAFIASHDLQEPLRMISSFMGQLKRKYGDQLDEKALQYIYFAMDGAKRMKTIILDLLEYSRAGKSTESLEDIDITELIGEYKLLRRKIIAEKKAQIRIGELPIVHFYKVPVTQTLHCLLDNALKYSKEGRFPQIGISAKEMKHEWIIRIDDNGIGIDPQFFEKIFIIFQRLHNREEYEGTGIGLSIAKKHVESWGGKIWLESILGEGTTFYFTLPKTMNTSDQQNSI